MPNWFDAQSRLARCTVFYDGMIVAAAERAGCKRILSEDFNTGQEYFGVTVANPFREAEEGIANCEIAITY